MRAFVVIVCIVVAVILAHGATTAPAQEALPEQSSLLTACNIATQIGQISGLNVSRCRRVAIVEEGNLALVTVKVWVDGQGVFLVKTGLQKSVWSQAAIDVVAAP